MRGKGTEQKTRRAGQGALAVILLMSLGGGLGCGDDGSNPPPVTVTKELVGKLLYFDPNLSTPPGQSCASCHAPDSGFADPHPELPVSQGANPNLVGNRNCPTVAYASFSPPFHWDDVEGMYVGGQMWDGRFSTLAEQAMGPPLNPLEMGTADEATLMQRIRESDYADLFEQIYGADIWDDPLLGYEAMADAIATYEASTEVNRFSSKYDAYLRGETALSAAEARGLVLFEDPAKGNCSACHPSQPAEDGTPPLFTDHTYDNLGLPRHPDHPFYDLPAEYNPDGADFVDLGLGGALDEAEQLGKFKVPTLRNVALTPPYGHNGVFQTLPEIVDFYNTRDATDWPDPEVADNVNAEELGDLGLTPTEVDDLVAFLRTLTDGWAPPP